MTIHERIKARRKECQLSVDEVAAELGVSRATIYRYESAEIANMGVDKIEPLARVLHTTPEYLMGWTDDPTDYEDGDLLTQIPLSYVKACDGDMKRAYAMWLAADRDVLQERSTALDFAKNEQEERMLLLARHMEPLSKEDRQILTEQFQNSIEIYLKAKGLSGTEDK